MVPFALFHVSLLLRGGGDGSGLHVAGFPLQLGTWTGHDLAIDEQTYELLETRDVMLREYRREDMPSVQLCLVFSAGNRKVAHPPEVCYRGGGWNIEAKRRTTGPGPFEVAELVITKGDVREVVHYWYEVGAKRTPSYLSQQIHMVLRQVIGRGGNTALVRLSTQIVGDGLGGARSRLVDFGRITAPAISDSLTRDKG